MIVKFFRKFPPRFLMVVSLCIPAFSAAACAVRDAHEEECIAPKKKIEWRLGPTAYTFRQFSFIEAVDKTKALGLDAIEAYEGQVVSKDLPEKIKRGLSDETIRKIRRKLDASGVKLTSIYIGSIPGDEAGCREAFEFAKKLGVETIISEPDPKDLDAIEPFCKKYKIKLAIHNHPKGHPTRSVYWDPRFVRKVCEGRSKWIGACADLGHWQRSGIKPVDGIRILGKRILSFHAKDLNEFGIRGAHDVPWGTGKGNLKAALQEAHRLGLEPTIWGIEYEYHWENSVPEVAECVRFFRQTVDEIRRQDKKTGAQR